MDEKKNYSGSRKKTMPMIISCSMIFLLVGMALASTPIGNKLDDLTDCNVPTPDDGNVLTYDTATSNWTAQAPTGGVSELWDRSDTTLYTYNDGDDVTVNGTLRVTEDIHLNSEASVSNTLLTLESDINNLNEYNEILFKVVGGANYGSIRSYLGSIGDSYMTFSTTTDGGSLVQRITIQHDGKIGFGTKNPEQDLEIVSSSPQLRIRDTGSTVGSTTAFIEFGGTDGSSWNRTGYIGDGSAGNLNLYFQAVYGDLLFGDSSGIFMYLQDGNVGIGKPNPEQALDIVGTINVTETINTNLSQYAGDNVTWDNVNKEFDVSLLDGNGGFWNKTDNILYTATDNDNVQINATLTVDKINLRNDTKSWDIYTNETGVMIWEWV